MQKLADSYKNPCIGTLGSHSALDICDGARKVKVKTLVACMRGREETYTKEYISMRRDEQKLGCVDEIMLLNDFAQLAETKNVKILQKKNVIFVPNRSFVVYVGADAILNRFAVPLFGNRELLPKEERNAPNNQLDLLKKAGIRTPKSFDDPSEIDRLVFVKVSQAKRSYERAFFIAKSYKEYLAKAEKRLGAGLITKEGLKEARIEEYVTGAPVNFNFFYSPIYKDLDFAGTDMRRQSNLDGLLRLTAPEQVEVLKHTQMSNIEMGHIATTIRESYLEKVFKIGKLFVETCKKEYSPGIIGPFALQGAVVVEMNGEDIVIFDVSFRMQGSPGTRYTPYMSYKYGRDVSIGERVAMEIKAAFDKGRLSEIVT